MKAPKNKQSGYSFIEVLTAFAILSFAIAALLPIFSNSLRTVKTMETRTLARLQLESLMAEVGVSRPLAAGDYAGAFGNGATWEIIITPQRMMRDTALFHIDAAVSFADRSGAAVLRIETLRIGPAAPLEHTDDQDNE